MLAINHTIVFAFEQVSRKYRDYPAVEEPAGRITYGALNSLANRIGRAIVTSAHTAQPVAVLLPKGTGWAAAFLGTMKSSRAAAPLDPERPLPQLLFQVADLEAEVLISSRALADLAGELGAKSVVFVEDCMADGVEPDLGLEVSPGSIGAVLYTSGTTGDSRGVMQSHRALLDNACRMRSHCELRPEDRILLLSVHSGSLFSALLSGGRISFLSEAAGGLAAVPARVQSERITVANATASQFRSILSMADAGSFASLRLLTVGSEAAFPSDFALFRKNFPPSCRFRTGYGSTETNGVTAMFLPNASECAGELLPLGRPYPGKEVLIRGPNGENLPPGEVGEVAIRSRLIGLGYWNRPEETRARFLCDPQDPELRTFLTRDAGRITGEGVLEIHGRLDAMVKIRGVLVSIPEVERSIQTLTGIREAVVAPESASDGGMRLIAYVQSQSAEQLPVAGLRAALSERLAPAAIPSAFVWVEDWPRLSSGKIDRQGLRRPGRVQPGPPAEPPVSPAECAIAGVWREALRLDDVGRSDHFLELGGDSLSAAVIAARLSRDFLVTLPASRVIACGTIARLASEIDQSVPEADLETLLTEVEALPPEEVDRLLASWPAVEDTEGGI